MILITDGFHSGSTENMFALFDEMKAQGVRVIALGFFGEFAFYSPNLFLMTNEVYHVSLILHNLLNYSEQKLNFNPRLQTIPSCLHSITQFSKLFARMEQFMQNLLQFQNKSLGLPQKNLYYYKQRMTGLRCMLHSQSGFQRNGGHKYK